MTFSVFYQLPYYLCYFLGEQNKIGKESKADAAQEVFFEFSEGAAKLQTVGTIRRQSSTRLLKLMKNIKLHIISPLKNKV